MKEIIIKAEQSKTYAINFIYEIVPDGSKTVIIKNTYTASTSKQRRMKWTWNTEISQSGLGRDDNPMDVHIRAKMQFGHPILMRDDEFYHDLFVMFRKKYQPCDDYPQRLKWFADNYIKTEGFSKKQQSEYLSEFQMFWIG